MESGAPAWVSWISLLLAIAFPIALFSFRNWITARITKGVQHEFDVKLEQLKSDLRDKEAEIGTLRNVVLSGSTGRQTLLDKRRFEAVEKIWTAVNDTAQLKALSQTMATLNYGFLALNNQNPKIQQFLGMIDAAIAPDPLKLTNVARDEQPFVPEITWAYYSAFTTLLTFNLFRFKTLILGIKDPKKFLNEEHVKAMLKATLPEKSPFIDEHDPGAYYYLLDEIQNKLLDELRKILEGKEADQSSIHQAKDILNATRQVNKDAQTKEVAKPIDPC